MEKTYFILKEFFLERSFPKDVLNYIMSLLVATSNFNIYNGENNLLQTPSDQIYNWAFDKANPYKCKLSKIELPSVRKVIQIFLQTFVLTKTNELYSLKSNEIKIILSNVRDILLEDGHIIAITINGTLWRMGYSYLSQESPLSNVKNVFCIDLYDMIFAITETDELYTWESKSFCQPEKVILPDKVVTKDIEVSGKSIALTTNNELYDLKGLTIILPNIRKGIYNHNRIMAITLTNELYLWGCRNAPLPVNMKLSNVKDAFFGEDYRVALTHNGDIYAWGDNRYGKLGTGNCKFAATPQKIDLPNVKEIYLHGQRSYAITYKNELFAWGYNANGELALGHKDKIYLPQKVEISNVKQIFFQYKCTIFATYSNKIYMSVLDNDKFDSKPREILF